MLPPGPGGRGSQPGGLGPAWPLASR